MVEKTTPRAPTQTSYATPAIPAGIDGATFLADPTTDKLVRVVMEIGAALWIERRRTRTLERALVRAGVIAPDAVEQWVDEPAAAAADREELERWMRQLYGPLAQIGGANDHKTGAR